MPPTAAPVTARLGRFATGAFLLSLALMLSACHGPVVGRGRAVPAADAARTRAMFAINTTPRDGARDVDPSAEVTVNVTDGRLTAVSLTSSGGPVGGVFNSGDTSWHATSALAVSTGYRLAVSAVTRSGTPRTNTISFRTLAPRRTLTVLQTVPGDGATVGVGQPIMVRFSQPVARPYRAALERAMVVTSTPTTVGAWSWLSATRVDWRPRAYWTAGTHVNVRLGIDGVRAGPATYGTRQVDFGFVIGDDVRAVASATGHWLKVYRDGVLTRTLRADTGKNGFSTWGGIMVVLDKVPSLMMTSCSVEITCDPDSPQYYDMPVYWDVHLTTSGTYVHEASWDESIGTVNSSHGCIHLRLPDAKWFYGQVNPGDIVQVIGSRQGTVAEGNGFGDWNVSWSRWLTASAAGAATT